MVSEVTVGTALDSASKTQAATTQLAEDFTQFLQLLTVQLQNQDPLEPLDSNELTNQIVAFTGVEQQINSNQKLDDLVALQLGSSLGQALGYVGLDISYISSEFYYDGQRPSQIDYALNGEAVEATVRVVDSVGNIVYEEAGSTNVGNNSFSWDGTDNFGNPAEPGTYTIRVDALDINDEPVVATTVVTGNVSGVETQNGALFAIVGDRAVGLGNVLNASQPPALEQRTAQQTGEPPSTQEEDST